MRYSSYVIKSARVFIFAFLPPWLVACWDLGAPPPYRGMPVITSIEGNGTALPIVDQANVLDQIDGRVDAEKRFQDKWIIKGKNLDTVSHIELEQSTEGGGALFNKLAFDKGGTTMKRTLTLPRSLVTGLFTLTLFSAEERCVQAQVYVLQGEPAERDCPRGYKRGYFDDTDVDSVAVLCQKKVAGGKVDEMVKVGDFWIDRYEASGWSEPNCGGDQLGVELQNPYPDQSWIGDWHEGYPGYSCSVKGVYPAMSCQWIGALMACALSGKALCTNAQWQAAALGTHDPGQWPNVSGACGWGNTTTAVESGPCNTCAGFYRHAGRAGSKLGGEDSCISNWGAEDMIGNMWEITADWLSVGDLHDWGDTDMPVSFINEGVWYWESVFDDVPDAGADASPPEPEFAVPYDSTWNLPGWAYRPSKDVWTDPNEQEPALTKGIPAVVIRGGSYEDGEGAGILAIDVRTGPTGLYAYYGHRCCINR